MKKDILRKLALVFTLLLLSTNCFGNYPGAKKNPDGTWVCGGSYSGAKKNPDGTWVVGWKRQGKMK